MSSTLQVLSRAEWNRSGFDCRGSSTVRSTGLVHRPPNTANKSKSGLQFRDMIRGLGSELQKKWLQMFYWEDITQSQSPASRLCRKRTKLRSFVQIITLLNFEIENRLRLSWLSSRTTTDHLLFFYNDTIYSSLQHHGHSWKFLRVDAKPSDLVWQLTTRIWMKAPTNGVVAEPSWNFLSPRTDILPTRRIPSQWNSFESRSQQ